MSGKSNKDKKLPVEGEFLSKNNTEDTNSNERVIHTLTPNKNSTVQPVALMRLGLFVPTLKSTGVSKKNVQTGVDATKELARLKFARAEGYSNVQIFGPRLDMDTDFRVWLGVVRSFHKFRNRTENGQLKIKFSEFTAMCGYPPKRLSKQLRTRLAESLLKLTATTLSFSDAELKRQYNTHLVQKSYYDEYQDLVMLQKDTSLDELYSIDHTVLLHLKVIHELPRKETAQALYTFLESLPESPIPVSFKRMRDRLNLLSSQDSQNQTIRKALSHLAEIGYLEFTEFKRGRAAMISIHSRNPKLGITAIEEEDEDSDGDEGEDA